MINPIQIILWGLSLWFLYHLLITKKFNLGPNIQPFVWGAIIALVFFLSRKTYEGFTMSETLQIYTQPIEGQPVSYMVGGGKYFKKGFPNFNDPTFKEGFPTFKDPTFKDPTFKDPTFKEGFQVQDDLTPTATATRTETVSIAVDQPTDDYEEILQRVANLESTDKEVEIRTTTQPVARRQGEVLSELFQKYQDLLKEYRALKSSTQLNALQCEERITALNQQLDDLNYKYDSYKKRVKDNLPKYIDTYYVKKDNLENRISTIAEERIAQAKTDAERRATERLRELVAEAKANAEAETQRRITQAQERLTQEKNQLEAEKNALAQQKEQLAQEKQSLGNRVNTRIEDLNKEISRLEEERQRINRTLEDERRRVATEVRSADVSRHPDFQNRCADPQYFKIENHRDFPQYQQRIQNCQAQLQNTQSELRTAQGQLRTDQNQLSTTKDQLRAVQDQLSAAQDQLRRAQESATNFQNRIQQLQEQMQAQGQNNQSDSQALRNQLNQCNQRLREKEQEVETLRNRMESLIRVFRDTELRTVRSCPNFEQTINQLRQSLGINANNSNN